MDKLKTLFVLLVVIWVITWAIFILKSNKTNLQEEYSCWIDTWVDTLNCRINEQENKILSLDVEYKQKVQVASWYVNEARNSFFNLETENKILQTMYKKKTQLMSWVSKVFPSDLVQSQN